LTLFTQDILAGIDSRNGRVGAVFIDLSKAFNSVNKEILLHKLAFKFGLPQWLVKIVGSYLTSEHSESRTGNTNQDVSLK